MSLICSNVSLWYGKCTSCALFWTVYLSMDLPNHPYYQRNLGRAYLLNQHSTFIADSVQRVTPHGVFAAPHALAFLDGRLAARQRCHHKLYMHFCKYSNSSSLALAQIGRHFSVSVNSRFSIENVALGKSGCRLTDDVRLCKEERILVLHIRLCIDRGRSLKACTSGEPLILVLKKNAQSGP